MARCLLLLLALQSISEAQARRAQRTQVQSRRLVTDQARVVQANHPGHPPHHVTRLHRYDHSGMQSMLEQEAQWTRQAQAIEKSFLSSDLLKESRHIRGAAVIQDSEDSEDLKDLASDFVRVSDIQATALQEHHQSWLHTSRRNVGDAKSGRLSAQGNPNSALLQSFKSRMTSYHQSLDGDSPVVATGLSSLNSQYVGPIGVGTVANPPGCVMRDGSAIPAVAEEKPSVINQIGGFFSDIQSKFTSAASSGGQSFQQTCTIEDQAQVWVVFDTGSTNIWISSDLCKSGPCTLPGRHSFNHKASGTYKKPESLLQLTVQFGTGRITGPQAVDDFHIGPFTVYNQTFAMIESEQGNVFREVPFEGIVGLAFDKMSANHVQPFFSSLIQQKAMHHNEFAFYFSRDNPAANALFWGGVDKNFYEGDLEYFPVVDPYYWSLKLLNFKIGEHVILEPSSSTYKKAGNPSRQWTGPVALVDTGTTFFTAESDKFHEVMNKLPPGDCKYVTEKTHPPITITLENSLGKPSDFVLNNKQYMTTSGKDSHHCSPAFMQIDIPDEHGPGMVLGEVFLRHFFAVFDRDTGKDADAKIALAKSSNKAEALSRLHELTGKQPMFGEKGGA